MKLKWPIQKQTNLMSILTLAILLSLFYRKFIFRFFDKQYQEFQLFSNPLRFRVGQLDVDGKLL